MSSLPRLRRRNRSRGQGLVEFALILPVFMLFLLIAVDFGRMLFTYIQLNNSAREAASVAAFNPVTSTNALLASAGSRETNVQNQRGEGAMTATFSCTDNFGAALACSAAQGGTGSGNRITVNVKETFTFFTPLIGSFWPGGLNIGASATAAIVDFAPGGGPPAPTCSTLPPTPVFTWQSPDPVNHPFLISVDANASTSLASPCQNVGYNWNFGGTSSDSPPNPDDPFREGVTQDYEFAVAGTYTVQLVVSNAAGDSAPYTLTISLGTTPCNPPTAAFTVTPQLNLTYFKNGPHPGSAFIFDGTSSAFMSDPACHPVWSWNLGDGSALQTTSVVSGYHYNTGGGWGGSHTVTVILTVRNDAGTDSHQQSLTMVQDK